MTSTELEKIVATSMAEAKEKASVVDAIDWRHIISADDAFKALADAGIQITNATDYGDGFTVIDDKKRLVDNPFIVVNARLAHGDFGHFSILHVITKQNEKFIVIDGSTGIYAQVLRHGVSVFIGLLCELGLTVSEYEYEDEKTGEKRPAKTYYIAGMK